MLSNAGEKQERKILGKRRQEEKEEEEEMKILRSRAAPPAAGSQKAQIHNAVLLYKNASILLPLASLFTIHIETMKYVYLIKSVFSKTFFGRHNDF